MSKEGELERNSTSVSQQRASRLLYRRSSFSFAGKERQHIMIDEERDATGLYLNEIGSRPLLSAEEEQRMAMQIRAGDESIRGRYIWERNSTG